MSMSPHYKSPAQEVEKGLTVFQRGKIQDVIYTLNYGVTKSWTNPKASLQACIDVLTEALNDPR